MNALPLLLLLAGPLLAVAGGVVSGGRMPGRESSSLADLYPPMRLRVDVLFNELEALGHRPVARSTWRSPARQAYYRERGWSQVSRSFHTVTGPGDIPESLAVDVRDGRWDADDDRQAPFYAALRQLARREGLRTGGEWARKGKWARFDLGWDPGHVEPVGITIAAAHAGARPWRT